MGLSRWTVAASLLQLASLTLAHGHDEGHDMDMKKPEAPQNNGGEIDPYDMPSYAGLGRHQGLILAHVVLMVLAWFFILPIGTVFSIARSKFAFPVQFLFLLVNGLGLLFGIVYNINTPDFRDDSPTVVGRRDTFDDFEKPGRELEPEDDEELQLPQQPRQQFGWLRISRIGFIDKYLSARTPNLLSTKMMRIIKLVYDVVDRLILLLGFIAMVTGFITYCGLLSHNVFTGLAHFIKGGIFFWYGLLTLGRWMGCFADLGWAWNIKPTRVEVGQWKSKIPSAEFTESFVIWLYGASNVFLEHLTVWGDAWSAQDLEHVSIAVMFFGGGLCGMLVESSIVRKCLNTVVDDMPPRTDVPQSEALELHETPKQYTTSLNPMPALIIILLGVMMSSHHQDSMVSTKVHGQWGTLLVGFGVARMFTYLIMFLSPPKSVYPSRPPTELVASFCLISGGIIFMASARDIVYYIEQAGLMAMFVLTVTCGFTAFIMAYEIIVLSLKGWAIRKEHKGVASRF